MEITPDQATRAIGIPSSSPKGTTWYHPTPSGSISTWEDLTTRFLAQFFPSGRTAKLRNDILMFQQHHEESLSEAWTLQRLMEPHLAPTQPTQVNKITTSYEICSGLHNTQICMENPEQAFVEYASSRTDEAVEGLVSEFMASQDARLSRFEADFKQQKNKMTNKIDTVLKSITNQIVGTLPSDTVKNPKLGTHPAHLNDTITMPQQPEEPKPTLEDEFKDLHRNLPVLEVLAHAPIYNAILDKYIESLELGEGG
ncbi:MAK10-like protein [Tanacetum coccineum]